MSVRTTLSSSARRSTPWPPFPTLARRGYRRRQARSRSHQDYPSAFSAAQACAMRPGRIGPEPAQLVAGKFLIYPANSGSTKTTNAADGVRTGAPQGSRRRPSGLHGSRCAATMAEAAASARPARPCAVPGYPPTPNFWRCYKYAGVIFLPRTRLGLVLSAMATECLSPAVTDLVARKSGDRGSFRSAHPREIAQG